MAKKILTKKQQLIILLLYSFRFLNSRQLQEFLQHKDHRRINSWLKDLTEKEFVSRDFTPIYGKLTKPAVYSLETRARKYLKDTYPNTLSQYLKKIGQDKHASKSFRIRCQIIADFYLVHLAENRETTKSNKRKKIAIPIIAALLSQLTDKTNTNQKNDSNTSYEFFTASCFPPFDLLHSIKPDLYIRRKKETGILHGFLFVLDSYIANFYLRGKIERFFTALDEADFASEQIHSIQFYFICPNNVISIYLHRLLPSLVNKYYGKEIIKFHFTTRNQMYKMKQGYADHIKWITLSSDD